jgi:hypothetical protein
LQIAHVEFVDIMPNQGQWDDKRHKVVSKIDDVSYEFLPLGRGKLFGKVAHHVAQHITMLFHRGMNGETFHEKVTVFFMGVGDGRVPNLGDDSPQLSVMPLAVGEEKKFVAGVKID